LRAVRAHHEALTQRVRASGEPDASTLSVSRSVVEVLADAYRRIISCNVDRFLRRIRGSGITL